MVARIKSGKKSMKRWASLLLLSSVVAAQIRHSSDREDNVHERSRDKRRKEKEDLLAFIVEITDSVTCEIDVDDRLPLFGIHHASNRRNLGKPPEEDFPPTEAPADDFLLLENGYDKYSIGTARNGVFQRRKSSKKGGNGKENNNRPPKKSKSSKGSRPVARPYPRPSARPVTRPTPAPRPTSSPNAPTPGQECTIQVNVDFLQFTAIPPALLVAGGSNDEQTLGTRYVYNDGLRDQDTLDELANSRASGTCTRTQAREGNDVVGLQRGAGHCHFTYSFSDSSNRDIVFTTSGEVTDEFGGILSVTGGSKATVGAYGEVELIPVNLLPNGQYEVEPGDFFLEPLFYLVDARIFVPCS